MLRMKLLGTLISVIVGIIIAATGIAFLFGGGQLISLGGSWYFALAGAGLAVSGVLLVLRREAGIWLYLAVFVMTVVWSVFEAGLSYWPLVSRLMMFAVLAIPVLFIIPLSRSSQSRSPALNRGLLGSAGVVFLAVVVSLAGAFRPIPLVESQQPLPPSTAGAGVATDNSVEWRYYGRTPSGTRFAQLDQITPGNVDKLQVAWTYHTGQIPTGGAGHVVTPLEIGGMVYGCTQESTIFALDADTGQEIWRFDAKAKGYTFPRCRSVAYYDATKSATQIGGKPVAPLSSSACAQRIVSTTVDLRLIELDALTGQPCEEFGNKGILDLSDGIGKKNPGDYFQTSGPTVARDYIIVGGWISDNLSILEPTGAVRAFNARTGDLVWAWDVGHPEWHGHPPADALYTRGSPNVWAPIAFDEQLGLVYLPTGNSTPDYWGGDRRSFDEAYNSSIVALDIETGNEKWKFQTVHHDLWDYDIPSQAALYDVPDGKGGNIPALIQTTKRGEIFMLDRRNGTPIAQVEERPVPQDGIASGEHLSPTQPFSVGMPSFGDETLSESNMWGMTPLDQLYCRIAFKKLRYQGEFTPPGPTPSLEYPGFGGGMNWGSSSVAENKGYLIVNDMRLAIKIQLIPRKVADEEFNASGPAGGVHGGAGMMAGTPYAVLPERFLSPLGIPCHEPPYGTVSAIDLATRKVVWSVPIGTVEDTGPLNIKMHLPIPLGMPTLGGPMTTSTGLVFFSGTQDKYLRALDLATGKELWRGRLPVTGETTPMSYASPKTGTQYVVVAAGGSRANNEKGDYLIAYKLPAR